MLYPGNIKKNYTKVINYKNRGMTLENLINEACLYYRENNIAIIYKKPTPIGISEVEYTPKGRIIKNGYFKEPSTLDYNGIYKGKYIEFDAKECHCKTSFPLNNIHNHQVEHIKKIINHGGIAFLIIAMNNEYFLFKGEDLIAFINTVKRKSIPFETLKQNGYNIKFNYNIGLDYIKEINNAYKELI